MLHTTVKASTIYTVVSFMVLYGSYSSSLWRTTDHSFYGDTDYAFMRDANTPDLEGLQDLPPVSCRFSESLILGRLVKTREDGLFSSGGLTGWFVDVPSPPEGISEQRFLPAYQYRLYLDPRAAQPVATYDPYRSQIGGHAFCLGVLDELLPLAEPARLTFYYHLTAALTALSFALILRWCFTEFRAVTGWFLTVCVAMFFSPNVLATNLYMALWAFYIPFLVMLYVHAREERSGRRRPWAVVFVVAATGMLAKLFLNGCEFITTTLIMALIPQCYYAAKQQWSMRSFVGRLGVSCGGFLLALGVFFAILLLQFAHHEGSLSAGVRYVYERLMLRTYGAGAEAMAELGTRDPASMLAVLKYYFTVPTVFDLGHVGLKAVFGMKSLFALVVPLSIGWMFVLDRKGMQRSDRRIPALLVSFWLSLLAPCSWFIVFKGHCDVHRTLDGIVWFMPSMFYAMALLGSSIDAAIRSVSLQKGTLRRRLPANCRYE